MASQQCPSEPLQSANEDKRFIILTGKHKGRYWCANRIANKHGLDLRQAIVARLREELSKLPKLPTIEASASKEEVRLILQQWIDERNDFGQCD